MRSTARTPSPRRRRRRRWQLFTRQYADPMQIVLLVAGIICLFLPGQFYTGVFLILLTMFNAWMAMNQEGKAEASASALQNDDGRQGEGPARRRPRRDPDGPARPGRHRQHRGRRPRPGRRPHPDRGDPRDRRVRAHRRERPDAQAGGRGRGRRRPRRPRGHGVHELPGHARLRHDPRRRPPGMATEVGHISGMLQATDGREDAADEAARRADEPDPGHRRHRARDLDRARPVPRRPGPGAVPERRRLRGGGDPDGAPGGRHGHPVEGLPDARRRPGRS